MPNLVLHARRRPAVRGPEYVGAAHEVLDRRALVPFSGLSLEEAVVERQQHSFVQLDAVELGVRCPGINRTAHLQLARPRGTPEALDVAARVQIDLAPDADRIEGHGDLMQALPRAARAPALALHRVPGDHTVEGDLLH